MLISSVSASRWARRRGPDFATRWWHAKTTSIISIISPCFRMEGGAQSENHQHRLSFGFSERTASIISISAAGVQKTVRILIRSNKVWFGAAREASIMIISVTLWFLEVLPTDAPERQQRPGIIEECSWMGGAQTAEAWHCYKSSASSASSLHAFGWKVTQTVRIVSISGFGARQRASSASSLPVCRWPAMVKAMLAMLAFRKMLMVSTVYFDKPKGDCADHVCTWTRLLSEDGWPLCGLCMLPCGMHVRTVQRSWCSRWRLLTLFAVVTIKSCQHHLHHLIERKHGTQFNRMEERKWSQANMFLAQRKQWSQFSRMEERKCSRTNKLLAERKQ